MADFSSGATVGRFRLERPLGQGAMGAVYLAIDPEIERHVAIKIIRRDATADPDQQAAVEARFLKEAKIAGRLQHPNIVTIYDVGRDAETLFIAMEYVEGRPLARFLRPEVALSDGQRLLVLRQTAEALSHAHERSVIHRDVKPGNILIRTDGVAKVSDFGIGKLSAARLLRAHAGGPARGQPFLHVARTDPRRGSRRPKRPVFPRRRRLRALHRFPTVSRGHRQQPDVPDPAYGAARSAPASTGSFPGGGGPAAKGARQEARRSAFRRAGVRSRAGSARPGHRRCAADGGRSLPGARVGLRRPAALPFLRGARRVRVGDGASGRFRSHGDRPEEGRRAAVWNGRARSRGCGVSVRRSPAAAHAVSRGRVLPEGPEAGGLRGEVGIRSAGGGDDVRNPCGVRGARVPDHGAGVRVAGDRRAASECEASRLERHGAFLQFRENRRRRRPPRRSPGPRRMLPRRSTTSIARAAQ